MDQNEVYTAILTGKLDNGLDRLEKAVRDRRKMLGNITFALLEVGDIVTIKLDPSQKPRYLDGVVGTIAEKRISKVVVTNLSHDPYNKFRNGILLEGKNVEKLVDEGEAA